MVSDKKDKPDQIGLASLFVKVMKRPLFKWTMVIYIVVIVAGVVYQALTVGFRSKPDPFEQAMGEVFAETDAMLSTLKQRLATLEAAQPIDPDRLDALVAAIEKFEALSTTDAASIVNEVASLKAQVNEIKTDLSNLKRSMNPSDPTDVITVARLGDQFALINTQLTEFKANVDDLEKSIDEKTKRNFDIVDAQVDRIVDLLKWLGLLLIPVVLNTLRTFLGGDGKAEKAKE